MVAAGLDRVMSAPSRVMVPDSGGTLPSSASASSDCPLPWTPATHSTSPPRTSKLTPSTTMPPAELATFRSRTSSRTSRSAGASFSMRRSTARPTIISARSASEVPGSACPTILPRRMTVMRSAMARTSRSLWVMKTIALPSSRSACMTAMSSSISCGVNTAVGSSKMRYFAS